MAVNSQTIVPVAANLLQSVEAQKTADQSVTNSTTLANDADLALAVLANAVYYFRFFVPFNVAGATSGFKTAITGPAAPTNLRYTILAHNLSTVGLLAGTSQNGFASTLGFAVANTGDHQLVIEGYLENGANAGTITLQFAQNTLDAVNAVTVRRGASILLKRIL